MNLQAFIPYLKHSHRTNDCVREHLEMPWLAPLALCLRSAALCHSQLLWLRPGPSLGSLGARLLNWFQQHQEPEPQASNLSLDYGTLTPHSLEASAGLWSCSELFLPHATQRLNEWSMPSSALRGPSLFSSISPCLLLPLLPLFSFLPWLPPWPLLWSSSLFSSCFF